MKKIKNKNGKQAVDIEDIDIDEPTVDIGDEAGPAEGVMLLIDPIEYRTKKIQLKQLSLHLKNVIIAFDGPIVHKVAACVDYFHHSVHNPDGDFKKAFAAALASDGTCVILGDIQNNLYVCSLDKNIWYEDVHTPDDFSNRFGGLTRLETRAKKLPSNLIVRHIITSEGHILSPVENEADYIEGNSYFYRVRDSLASDLATYLVYVAKTGDAETYVTGSA